MNKWIKYTFFVILLIIVIIAIIAFKQRRRLISLYRKYGGLPGGIPDNNVAYIPRKNRRPLTLLTRNDPYNNNSTEIHRPTVKYMDSSIPEAPTHDSSETSEHPSQSTDYDYLQETEYNIPQTLKYTDDSIYKGQDVVIGEKSPKPSLYMGTMYDPEGVKANRTLVPLGHGLTDEQKKYKGILKRRKANNEVTPYKFNRNIYSEYSEDNNPHNFAF